MTLYDNCNVCDVIINRGMMLRCLDCNYHFCSPFCAGFEVALKAGISDSDIAFVEGVGYRARNCVICRGEKMNDTVAYGYLLEVFKMSRETAMKLIRGHLLSGGMHKSK